MSEIYVLEPPTSGKVALNTTHGTLDIELWAKECPKACRNFVQLCIDGYYDQTPFHRVIKDFIVQGGDPTGTGVGGDSIYSADEPFPLETHPRLMYRYRGLVGLASLNPDALDDRDPQRHSTQKRHGSQFFITLARADALNRKNTLFGKVTGHSVYNLLSLADTPVDKKTDTPLDPPRILSTQVYVNPFPDLVPRPGSKALREADIAESERRFAAEVNQRRQAAKVVRKQLAAKRANLLSFDESSADEDALDNDSPTAAPAASTAASCTGVPTATGAAEQYDAPLSEFSPLGDPGIRPQPPQKEGCTTARSSASTQHAESLQRLKERVLQAQVNEATSTAGPQGRGSTSDVNAYGSPVPDDIEASGSSSDDSSNTTSDSGSDSEQEKEESELEVVKQSRKQRHRKLHHLKEALLAFKRGEATADKQERDMASIQNADLLTDYEKRRQLYLIKRQQTGKRRREENVLEKLEIFTRRLREGAASNPSSETAAGDEEDDKNASEREWLSGNGLRFAVDSARAYELDAAKDALVTFDPLASRPKAEVEEKMRQRQRERMKPSLIRKTLV